MSIERGNPVARALAALLVAMSFAAATHAADGKYGLGRAATPKEIEAWDIDVRPDFTGLPKGSGSVERGQEIWDAKCASCHGVFGESNEFFNPIIGGTTAEDAKTGNVRSLTTSELQRTTMMKLSSLATMWDYIRRAMPWTAPKSLSVDEVYAVTAYILHLADLVPAAFTLSDANIRATEQLLPNRNGMTQSHGMWTIRGRPDVRNTACMTNCVPATPTVRSAIPDYARNAHGNLAAQNRNIGGVRGTDTSKPPQAIVASAAASMGASRAASMAAPVAGSVAAPAAAPVEGSMAAPAAAPVAGSMAAPAAAAAAISRPGNAAPPHPMLALATKHGCMACHGIDRASVGPSFRNIAARHAAGTPGAVSPEQLATSIRAGGAGKWGSIPMPPQPQLTDGDARALAGWIATGASPVAAGP